MFKILVTVLVFALASAQNAPRPPVGLDNRCPPQNGNFAESRIAAGPGLGCEHFIMCETGSALPFQCPDGSIFNDHPDVRVCDSDWVRAGCPDGRNRINRNPWNQPQQPNNPWNNNNQWNQPQQPNNPWNNNNQWNQPQQPNDPWNNNQWNQPQQPNDPWNNNQWNQPNNPWNNNNQWNQPQQPNDPWNNNNQWNNNNNQWNQPQQPNDPWRQG